jgi:hypothetical protein
MLNVSVILIPAIKGDFTAVVLLVHCLIQKGKEEDFKKRWYHMTVGPGSGLYREILAELDLS